VDVHRSARKNGVADEDALHAAGRFLVTYPLSDEGQAGPRRELRLGPDRAGNLLEIVCCCSTTRRAPHPCDADETTVSGSPAMITGEPRMSTDARDGRTSGGVPVTDDVVEQLADEAEAGYDVPTLRRRGGRPSLGSGPAEVVPVRIDPGLRAALAARADADATTVSEVIRQALRAWLHVA